MIKVNVKITKRELELLENKITKRAAGQAFRKAEQGAAIMEREVLDIIRDEFITDRPANRRKRGTVHLINSFVGVVEGTRGELPVTAVLRAKPGLTEDSLIKIRVLEHGSSAHEIPPGENGLAFPRGDPADPVNRGRNAFGVSGDTFWTDKSVVHPGTKPYHFLRRARERAVARLRS